MDRILVALDSSSRARSVLAAAVDLATRTRGKVHLLRAVPLPPELPGAFWSAPPPDVTTATLRAARSELDALARDLPEGLVDGTTAQVGAPWDAICETAREIDADLIVLGSHGHGLWDRLLGTTAAKVVNHADRSVYVVRDRDDRGEMPR
jgi:nucleotide-binding universal stress UspA family protein